MLYNIGSFKTPARNGIRFEHGPKPGDREYRFGYRYALTESKDSFTHWQKGESKFAAVWSRPVEWCKSDRAFA